MCMQDSIDVFQTHVLSVIRVTPGAIVAQIVATLRHMPASAV